VELSWPLDNFGPSLPNLMSTVAGNLFELNQLSAIRLIDLELPKAFLDRYPGPAFGPNGTRRLAGVEKFPLIGTIIKPSVGLTPAATADLVTTLVGGGINFIKDDELQADGPLCPFEDRVKAVMRVVNAAADAQGQKPMFAFNLTGEIDEMRQRHDIVVAAGGTCVMVSLNSVGLVGVAELRRHAELPIHAHRNGWGLYYRSPHIGIDYRAYQKLWRILGVDHMHVNGLRNKFAEDGASSIASAKACLTPLSEIDPRLAMPVFSSGQWAGQVPETYAALGSADLIYCCGGGIVAQPQGVKAGVESIREAWAAAFDGESLESRARSKPALAAALAFFQ
jgi:ribulose-bisphosphate carboxylase large chain